MRSRALKRVMDLIGGGFLLLAASPLILVVAGLIRMKLGAPILFRQARAGLDGRPFTLLKFRTMTDARGPGGALLPDERRLPPLGAWLRRSTLDELPGLVNVIRGEMSLVGPRPLHVRYLERYTPEQARRHEVKPGLTGWAVVHGRNTLSWPERLRLDIWYVDHWSFALDLRISFQTLTLVLRRRGVSAEGHATMPEFAGGNEP